MRLLVPGRTSRRLSSSPQRTPREPGTLAERRLRNRGAIYSLDARSQILRVWTMLRAWTPIRFISGRHRVVGTDGTSGRAQNEFRSRCQEKSGYRQEMAGALHGVPADLPDKTKACPGE